MRFLLTVSLIIIATMTVVPAHRNLLADDVHSVRSLSGAVLTLIPQYLQIRPKNSRRPRIPLLRLNFSPTL